MKFSYLFYRVSLLLCIILVLLSNNYIHSKSIHLSFKTSGGILVLDNYNYKKIYSLGLELKYINRYFGFSTGCMLVDLSFFKKLIDGYGFNVEIPATIDIFIYKMLYTSIGLSNTTNLVYKPLISSTQVILGLGYIFDLSLIYLHIEFNGKYKVYDSYQKNKYDDNVNLNRNSITLLFNIGVSI